MRFREPYALIKRGKGWYYRLASDPKLVAHTRDYERSHIGGTISGVEGTV